MSNKEGTMKRLASYWSKKYKLIVLISLVVVLIVIVIIALKFKIFASTTTGNNCKYLVSYGISNRAFPDYIASHIRTIEQNYPYDGQGIQTSSQSSIMRSTALSYNTVKTELNPLFTISPKPTKLNHSLFQVLLNNPGDVVTNTAGWDQAVQNFKTFAKVLKELDNSGFGVDGILFDNEGPYSDPDDWSGYWNYPPCYASDYTTIVPCTYNNSGRSLSEYQTALNNRGKEIMQAMAEVFPDIKVVIMHSSDISCTDHNLYRFNELIGSFTVGLMEGTYGTNAQLIDGSEESYDFTTESQFINRYDYLKNLPNRQPQCSFIPTGDRDINNWKNYYKVGHGLYNKQQTTSTIAKAVEYALNHSDNFVWFYVEGVTTIGNTQSYPQISQAWTDAISAGRNAVINDPNCGTPTSPSPTSTVVSPTPTLSPSPSPTISTSPSSALCEPTPAPGLTASVISSTQVNLAWTDTLNENGYSVKRSTSGSSGPFSEVYNTGLTSNPHATSWSDTTVSPNTNYWYRVDAYNGCGSGTTLSNVVGIKTPGNSGIPTAPSSLMATSISSSQINLSWSDRSTNEDGFVIERSTSATTGFVQVGSVGANTNTFQSTGLQANKTYYFRVKAFNISGNSAYSNAASARTKKRWWIF